MTTLYRLTLFAILLPLASCRPASGGGEVSPEAPALSEEVVSRVPIGNRRLQDLIELETPGPETVVASPLHVRGKVRALWFHEGKFPIELQDEEGHPLAAALAESRGVATSTEDWLPFEASFHFQVNDHRRGYLVLNRANPQQRSEQSRSLRLPILFPDR